MEKIISFEDFVGCYILYTELDPNMVLYNDGKRDITLYQFFSLCAEIKEWQNVVRTVLLSSFPDIDIEANIKYMRHIIEQATDCGYEFPTVVYTAEESEEN